MLMLRSPLSLSLATSLFCLLPACGKQSSSVERRPLLIGTVAPAPAPAAVTPIPSPGGAVTPPVLNPGANPLPAPQPIPSPTVTRPTAEIPAVTPDTRTGFEAFNALCSSRPTDENVKKTLKILMAAAQKSRCEDAATYLNSLESLELRDKDIVDITPITTLKNLKYLNLGSNKISKLDSLANLQKLETLTLYKNDISQIGGILNLPSLKNLSLSGNPKLPHLDGIEKLTSLKSLYVSNSSLPDLRTIADMPSLEVIDAAGSAITEIPNLSKLINLKKLSLNSNQISDMSPLQNVPQISEVYLGKNKIKEIPPLKGLPKLAFLFLNGNEITNPKGLAAVDADGKLEINSSYQLHVDLSKNPLVSVDALAPVLLKTLMLSSISSLISSDADADRIRQTLPHIAIVLTQ